MTQRIGTAAIGLAALFAISAPAGRRRNCSSIRRSKPTSSRRTRRPSRRPTRTSIPVGAQFYRHHHGQAAGREGQSAGRRRHGPGRDLADAARQEGMLHAVRAGGARRDQAAHARHRRPAELGWHGRLVVGLVLQHRRGRGEGPAASRLPGPISPSPNTRARSSMPNPASSGTGYLMVSAWLQMMGEEKGWAYMDALHENIAAYTHSGSKPCRQAGAGEYAVGLSFEYRANKTKADGAPIDIVLPSEGLGWDMEATGIMATPTKPMPPSSSPTGRCTQAANELYAKNYAIVALPGIAAKLEFIAGRRRGDADQERLRLGGRESRAHPRRVDAPLRQASPSPRADAALDGALRDRPRSWRAPRVRLEPGDTACNGTGRTRSLSAGPRLTKRFGPFTALEDVDLDIRARRVRVFSRPLGLRQDNAAARDLRTRHADDRAHPPGRARHLAPAGRPARFRHRLPVLRAVPEPEDPRQRRLRARLRRRIRREDIAARVAELLDARRPPRAGARNIRRSSRAASSSA